MRDGALDRMAQELQVLSRISETTGQTEFTYDEIARFIEKRYRCPRFYLRGYHRSGRTFTTGLVLSLLQGLHRIGQVQYRSKGACGFWTPMKETLDGASSEEPNPMGMTKRVRA